MSSQLIKMRGLAEAYDLNSERTIINFGVRTNDGSKYNLTAMYVEEARNWFHRLRQRYKRQDDIEPTGAWKFWNGEYEYEAIVETFDGKENRIYVIPANDVANGDVLALEAVLEVEQYDEDGNLIQQVG